MSHFSEDIIGTYDLGCSDLRYPKPYPFEYEYTSSFLAVCIDYKDTPLRRI